MGQEGNRGTDRRWGMGEEGRTDFQSQGAAQV